MAWTATLISAVDRDHYWKIIIRYVDDVENRTAEIAYQWKGQTIQELGDFVRAQALTFEKTDPVDLSPHVGQSIDVTPPVVVPPDPPTPEEIAENAWFDDWEELNQLIKVTTTLPALNTQQAIDLKASLTASLEADWLNSYLGRI